MRKRSVSNVSIYVLILMPIFLPKTGVTAMIDKRPFDTLGHADHGWLNARHHFSFASYHDESRMGWGALRVWNDDEIAANSGFPAHPHQDMEIITYVRQGAITHQDSMGNKGRTEAGDVQVMSAGSGIRHAEYNLEPETTRIFQIWILPRERGGQPSWGAKPFPKGDRSGRFVTLASGFADDGDALPIRADARVLGATLKAGESVEHAVGAGRHAYLVPAIGRIEIDGVEVNARDGAALTGGQTVRIAALEDAEIVLVDAD
jgi:redox-sensitive bicupin YhaK (pirin superfamily)